MLDLDAVEHDAAKIRPLVRYGCMKRAVKSGIFVAGNDVVALGDDDEPALITISHTLADNGYFRPAPGAVFDDSGKAWRSPNKEEFALFLRGWATSDEGNGVALTLQLPATLRYGRGLLGEAMAGLPAFVETQAAELARMNCSLRFATPVYALHGAHREDKWAVAQCKSGGNVVSAVYAGYAYLVSATVAGVPAPTVLVTPDGLFMCSPWCQRVNSGVWRGKQISSASNGAPLYVWLCGPCATNLGLEMASDLSEVRTSKKVTDDAFGDELAKAFGVVKDAYLTNKPSQTREQAVEVAGEFPERHYWLLWYPPSPTAIGTLTPISPRGLQHKRSVPVIASTPATPFTRDRVVRQALAARYIVTNEMHNRVLCEEDEPVVRAYTTYIGLLRGTAELPTEEEEMVEPTPPPAKKEEAPIPLDFQADVLQGAVLRAKKRGAP